MSQSIGIPGFLNERKSDILHLNTFKDPNKRKRADVQLDRIRYSTRSYLSYKLSHSVKQKRKFQLSTSRVGTVCVLKKKLLRRDKRRPNSLQCIAFSSSLDQSRKFRLLTHIWHAKRMFMKNYYKWMLPSMHRGRGFKSVQRLFENRSIIQDISYLQPICLTGESEALIELITHFVDPALQLHEIFANKLTASEMELNFYEHCKFPIGCIGPVSILLVPNALQYSENHNKDRVIWVSVHPAILEVVYQQLKNALSSNDASQGDVYASISLQSDSVAISRFKLRGSTAADVLQRLLQLSNRNDISEHCASQSFTKIDSSTSSSTSIEYLIRLFALRNISKHWCDGECLSANITDPRLFPPALLRSECKQDETKCDKVYSKTSSNSRNSSSIDRNSDHAKNKKLKIDKSQCRSSLVRPANIGSSSLWHCGGVSDINQQQQHLFDYRKDHEVNEMKHCSRIAAWDAMMQPSSSSLSLGFVYSNDKIVNNYSNNSNGTVTTTSAAIPNDICPLVLIRKESPVRYYKTHKCSMAGWDILLPKVWVPTIWHALQLAGAVPVGMEEMEHISSSKCGVPCFPRDYPDTVAGKLYWEKRHRKQQAINKKKPPRKRTGHDSLTALLHRVLLVDISNQGHSVDDESCDNDDNNNGEDPSMVIESDNSTVCVENEQQVVVPDASVPASEIIDPNDGQNVENSDSSSNEQYDDITDATSSTVDIIVVVRGEAYLTDFRPPSSYHSNDISITTTDNNNSNSHSSDLATTTTTMTEEKDEDSQWISPYIPLLPSLPYPALLQVLLYPTSRGLILDLAEIYCPMHADYSLWCKHKLNTVQQRKKKQMPNTHHLEYSQTKQAHHIAKSAKRKKKVVELADLLKMEEDALSKDWHGCKLNRRCMRHYNDNSKKCIEEENNEGSNSNSACAATVAAVGSSIVNNGAISQDPQLRQLMGTVTSGQKSHLNNTDSFAIGFCSVVAMNHAFRRSFGRYPQPQVHMLVLFRNTRSEWLRPALLQII